MLPLSTFAGMPVRRRRRLSPGAEQERFSDAAHLPSVEHPERFTAMLRAWLTRHSL